MYNIAHPLTGPNAPEHVFTLPLWMTTIIATLVFLLLIGFLGKIIPHHDKWDNVIMLLLGLFGIVGVLAQTPPFVWFQHRLGTAFASGNAGAGGDSKSLWIVTGIFAAMGMVAFYKKQTFATVAFMTVTTLGLFLNGTMFNISKAYMNTVGDEWFHGIVGFFSGLF